MLRKPLLAALLALASFTNPRAATNLQYGPQCVILYPTGDGTITNWTALGGSSKYLEVDDVGIANCAGTSAANSAGDDDTSYIQCANAITCSASFDLTNSASYTGTNRQIRYVTGWFGAKKVSGAPSQVMVLSLLISSTKYSLFPVTVSIATTTYTLNAGATRYYTNPATGLPWTSADVDALQVVIEDTTTGGGNSRVTTIGVVVAYEDAFATIQPSRLRSAGD